MVNPSLTALRVVLLACLAIGVSACALVRDSSHHCEPPGSRADQPWGGVPVLHALDRPPEQIDDGWSVSTAEMEGFDPEPLREMLEAVEDGDFTKLDSILIARHGKLVLEAYFNGFDRETKHDTRSAFKSITSTFVGVAVDRGLIADLDAPVSTYFPNYWPKIEGDLELKSQITLANLLTMTPGFDAEEGWGIGPYREDDMWDSSDWIRFTLDLPMARKPGERFSYNSSTTFLLGQVVARAADEPLPAFAKREFFEPLGITDYCWTLTGKGRAVAQGSFFIRPRDMLKVGQLFLDGGLWQGRRVVSADWVANATARQVDAGRPNAISPGSSISGYGYQWWTKAVRPGEDPRIVRYFASGNGGQKIFVFPKLDMVVVFNGSHYNKKIGHQQPWWILTDFVFPAVLD